MTMTRSRMTRMAQQRAVLAQMTAKAIELLERVDRRGDDRKGFFLQVEGASIDTQDHVENPCQQIGETIAFDRAVRVGLEYARRHPDTLIIVTADHAHTSQIVPVVGLAETSWKGVAVGWALRVAPSSRGAGPGEHEGRTNRPAHGHRSVQIRSSRAARTGPGGWYPCPPSCRPCSAACRSSIPPPPQ